MKPMKTKSIVSSTLLAIALAGLLSAGIARAECDLYPIALSAQTLASVQPGARIPNILNGVQPGNFGWLTWAGSPSEKTLATSLSGNGDSSTYTDPSNPANHQVSIGSWVQGKPGVSNGRSVRSALTALKAGYITVPVWDNSVSQGNNTLYHVVGFAVVKITDFDLSRPNRISATFVGFTDCSGGNNNN